MSNDFTDKSDRLSKLTMQIKSSLCSLNAAKQMYDKFCQHSCNCFTDSVAEKRRTVKNNNNNLQIYN